MILGSLSLRTVAGSAVPRGSGGGYSCSWVPLALLHRFTMNYQKAHCSTQHQPPPYASTSTQRGYADFRRHLPSSGYTVTSIFSWSKLFMCCLLYTRDWIYLNKDFHYSDAIWAPACSTSTYKNIKTLHYWSVQRLGGTAVHQWIPSQRVSNTEKVSMMWRMMSCLF